MRGTVAMSLDLVLRLDYGSLVPWVRRTPDGIGAIGGASALRLRTPVSLHGEHFHTVAKFTVAAGERVPFTLSWYPSCEPEPPAVEPEPAIEATERWWAAWSERCTYDGEWRDPVVRSLITLKALTYAPSGGLVAAATTSLPERLGGVRNWDYRYCWLRDATFALYALMTGGYVDEARAWRAWLLRAIAGKPSQAQILYGVAGERLLPEWEIRWLPGYERSVPARVGNAATTQFQLDVFGEVVDALHVARRVGLEADEDAWRVEQSLVAFVESAWQEPDEGIWEVRGPRRPFTHSKVMAWVAVDRAVKAVERFRLEGPSKRWREVRAEIHADVCRNGFDREIGSFVQYYGSKLLDASLLMMPLVGFLPATDPRVLGTVEAIQKHLMSDGLVARYQTTRELDGLPPGEGAFLPCTFWLADNLALQGRRAEARALFERLLELRNDVGSCPSSTIRSSAICWATSRRRSPTSASSTRRATSRAATARPSTARRVDDAGGYAGCSLKENRRPEPSSLSRSSEYRSCVQISKQRRWRYMALLPGLPARPFIASWPVPMVMSQPTHGSPVAERPSTFAAFSRGRRPLSSFLRMIWRIVPKSMTISYGGRGRNRPSGVSLSG
jgi:GH15 family glucan-1,4-alpha-glucosidase